MMKHAERFLMPCLIPKQFRASFQSSFVIQPRASRLEVCCNWICVPPPSS